MDLKMEDVNLLYQKYRNDWLYEKDMVAKEVSEKLQVILDKMGRRCRVTDLEIAFLETL